MAMARAVRFEQNSSGRLPRKSIIASVRIGHECLEQGPRRPGHFEQIGNGPAPSAGGGKHDPRRGIVNLLDELID